MWSDVDDTAVGAELDTNSCRLFVAVLVVFFCFFFYPFSGGGVGEMGEDQPEEPYCFNFREMC